MSNDLFAPSTNTFGSAPIKTAAEREAEDAAELKELEALEKLEAEEAAEAEKTKKPAAEEAKKAPSAPVKAPVRKKRVAAAGGARGAAGVVRQAAQKALDVEAADTEDRRIAAAILGCEDDTVDLTTAILSSPKQASAMRALDDGESVEIVDGDVNRVVEAGSLERERLRALWQVLHLLGDLAEEMPGSDIKAAAEAAAEIDGYESKTAGLRELLTKN